MVCPNLRAVICSCGPYYVEYILIIIIVRYISPFPVTFYCGPTKPKSLDSYLGDFILELNDLISNGMVMVYR